MTCVMEGEEGRGEERIGGKRRERRGGEGRENILRTLRPDST